MKLHKRIFSVVVGLLTMVACSPGEQTVPPSSSTSQSASVTRLSVAREDQRVPFAAVGFPLCSPLNFTGIQWASNLNAQDMSLVELALSMSGSFEGHSGWANLSNNFDGQGMSVGILNQNLGQGSLQPMFSEMLSSDPVDAQAIFSKVDYNSLKNMVERWQGKAFSPALQLSTYGYSNLDDPTLVEQESGIDSLFLKTMSALASSRNQASVTWAIQNVYNGSAFKKDWSDAFVNMANSAEYRTIQVEKSVNLHKSALALMRSYGLRELRSYLFLYDILVQNGGLSSKLHQDFSSWVNTVPSATDLQRLNKILALRLRTVRKQYVQDVASRKETIITGQGTIHGQKRDFEKEYCVSLSLGIE